MLSHLTFGSVCSGIEAASVAWHPLGWQPAWFAEIEPFPCAVLAHRFPHVKNLGDMTAIAAMVRDGTVVAPDILVGGTPCQAFSVAGARAGLADPRGQLTLAYVDLANALDTARSALGRAPAISVWENVPGVLTSKDNAFGCFLGALCGESDELKPAGRRWTNAGCVFGPQRVVAWRVLDAQHFGVAQQRRRVFVVASARNGFDPAAVLFEFDGVRRADRTVRGEEPNDAVYCVKGAAIGRKPTAGPQYGELKLGTSYTLNCTEEHAVVASGAARRLTPVECERLQGFPDNWTRIPWRSQAENECPDRPRYKALGNSMATTGMSWIGLRVASVVTG